METILILFMSGFSIGLIGSFHCLGMCGPLALALPINHLSPLRKYVAILLYNSGRAFSYAILGLLFGLIGQSFSFFKIQQWLSIFAGLFILIFMIVHQLKLNQTGDLNRFSIWIKNKIGSYLKSSKHQISFLSIGMLNGLLPCGLVYVALAASVATGNSIYGAVLMFSFGLGTMAIMILIMGFGKLISSSFRMKLNKISPFLIVCVSLILIVRGLNLGIPYISPKYETGTIKCCKP